MGNLKEWIEESANGKRIRGVVIGEMGWGSYGSDRVPGYDKHPRNVVISWKEAAPMLDYEFDSGYGAPFCEAIYAWTKARVIFIVQYDGATWPGWVPRNPQDCKPIMFGGG